MDKIEVCLCRLWLVEGFFRTAKSSVLLRVPSIENAAELGRRNLHRHIPPSLGH